MALGEGVEESGVGFLQPPADMRMEQFLQDVGIGAEASPAGEEEDAGILPTSVSQAIFAGGAHILQGVGGQAVVDIGPGEWMLWADDMEAPQMPLFYTIAGEMPATLPEPAADIDVTFIGFGITVEGALTAGEHVLRIENQGAQPHFLELLKSPDEHVRQILEADMGGDVSPAPLPFDPGTDLSFAWFTAEQSIGIVTWAPLTLEQVPTPLPAPSPPPTPVWTISTSACTPCAR